MISSQKLIKAYPSIPVGRAATIAPMLNQVIKKYNIDPISEVMFVANLLHETGGFASKVESTNYTNATRIVKTWKSRFNLTGTGGKLKASNYTGKPKELAIAVYGDRMGNVKGTDDGWIFRGGGYAQLTGREAYALYMNYLKETGQSLAVSVEDMAKLIQTADSYALDSAGWFFAIWKKLNGLHDFEIVVKKWNGGLIGYDNREAIYNRLK